jgi:hypothetical protein
MRTAIVVMLMLLSRGVGLPGRVEDVVRIDGKGRCQPRIIVRFAGGRVWKGSVPPLRWEIPMERSFRGSPVPACRATLL